MAFTAGSVQLARAERLGSQLGNLFSVYGLTGTSFNPVVIEKQARKLGFGITGITTGAGFPPFGSLGGVTGAAKNVEAVLQNPSGLTQPNGITVSQALLGQTVGIYWKAQVRSGADTTVTSSSSGAVAGTTFENFAVSSIFPGRTATIYFASGTYSVG